MVIALIIASIIGLTDTLEVDRYAVIEGLLGEHEVEEDLELWLTAGIDINTASQRDIARIPGVDPRSADLIIAWRDSLGGVRSMAFLDTVTVIAPSDVDLLRAFLTIGTNRRSTPRTFVSVTSMTRLSRRLETAWGYQGGPDERVYLGRPERMQQRLNLSAGRVRSGLTFDKPQGSPFIWQPDKSWYGFTRVQGFITAEITPGITIVAGDFRAEYGQGLAMWGGSSFGKGREVVRTVERRRSSLRGSASTMNERVFRGVGVSIDLLPGVRADLFASRRTLDAVIDTVTNAGGEVLHYASISTPSLHRTPLELDRRKTLGEDVIGGALLWQTNAFALGATAYSGSYGLPIRRPDRPDLIFHSTERTFSHGSIFGSLDVRSARLFGEMVPTSAQIPFTVGARTMRHRHVEAVVAYRNLPPSYHNPFSAGFAHRSSPMSNERGLYLGAEVRTSSTSMLRGYVDMIEHPWIRYLDPRPARGMDALLEWRQRPRRWFDYYFLYRRRSIDQRLNQDGSEVGELVRMPRHSVRLHLRLSPTSTATIQSRVEAVRSNSPEDGDFRGYLLFQEVQIHPTNRLRLGARLTQFDIENFSSRVYAYEYDVTGAFSSRMFTGVGTRAYALSSIRVTDRIELQARAARSWFEKVDYVGSGYERIDGRRVTDLTFQLIGRR